MTAASKSLHPTATAVNYLPLQSTLERARVRERSNFCPRPRPFTCRTRCICAAANCASRLSRARYRAPPIPDLSGPNYGNPAGVLGIDTSSGAVRFPIRAIRTAERIDRRREAGTTPNGIIYGFLFAGETRRHGRCNTVISRAQCSESTSRKLNVIAAVADRRSGATGDSCE